MNPNQKRNAIILGVLGLILAFFVYRAIFGETEQQRMVRENAARNAQQQAAGDAAAQAPGAPAAPAARSQFQKAAVDVDQLIAGIREVEFSYDTERMPTNPMSPLVGPMAPRRLASGQPGDEPAATSGLSTQSALRNFRVTGILWDQYDPLAVMTYPAQGQMANEVVARGYTFPEFGFVVQNIEVDRVILNVNNTLVPIQLEER
ncbi:MAG: hypothetical protein AMXMBFR4_22830 [Candidatus Hydrogenedentota bacterium]